MEFLCLPHTSVTVSLDGFEQTHDTFRLFADGRGSWSTIVRNIEELQGAGVSPFIAATISEDTVSSAPLLLRWINERHFGVRLNIVRQADCTWERSSVTDSAYERICSHLIEAFTDVFSELMDDSYSFDFVSKMRIADLHFDLPVYGTPCSIGYNHIVVKPDGRVVACPMNIAERGVPQEADLLRSCQTAFSFPDYQRLQFEDNGDCSFCPWFNVCAGGCPVTNIRMNGGPVRRSPFCDFQQFVIPAFIRLLAHKMIQSEGGEVCNI